MVEVLGPAAPAKILIELPAPISLTVTPAKDYQWPNDPRFDHERGTARATWYMGQVISGDLVQESADRVVIEWGPVHFSIARPGKCSGLLPSEEIDRE